MPATALTDLPPELLEQITTYLPAAQSLASLSRTNKNLHTFVEKNAWRTFAGVHFPSLCPKTSSSWKLSAQNLTAQSRAWDRRAFVAKYIEPHGDITAYPGKRKADRWKRPKGQTIGFTPHTDVYEHDLKNGVKREVLAYSAGAEVCVRIRGWRVGRNGKEKDKTSWQTYRPLTAFEGRDDVTTVQLVRPKSDEQRIKMITGTANGDLQMITFPDIVKDDTDVERVFFTTQGQSVRSSSLLHQDGRSGLLAAEVGDSKICLYPLEDGQPKIAPSSQIDIKLAARECGDVLSKAYRPWSTNFLSGSHLAVGLGPSEEPIHIYTLTPSGISSDHVRKFTLSTDYELDDRSDEIAPGGVARKTLSSVYPIVPLPPCSAATSNQDAQVFLSGAYDGVVRLHDLRSPRDVEGTYNDPIDDSAIYSLLPRGRESLLVGSNRHNLLKVFDMRLGSKCYSYLDAQPTPTSTAPSSEPTRDWSLFLRPHNSSVDSHSNFRGGWQSRRVAESSIYTLASPSASSPHVYAGIENGVVELAFTDIMDPHPDPNYFKPWKVGANGKGEHEWNGWRTKDVIDLACYDQRSDMKLCTQRSMVETVRAKGDVLEDALPGLDRRWRVGGS